ncbi:hypothetical protein MMPV_002546 [Pyropia vietnamensis]
MPTHTDQATSRATSQAKVVGVWDNLTRGDLDRAVAAGTLRLALVGMSNCGKSHRSSELVTAGHQARVVVGGHQAGALDPGSDGRRGGSDGVTQGVFPAAPEAAPFSRFCVDDKIEVELEQELSLAGLTGIEGLATWMGTPADDHFWAAQARYLELEEGITANAIRSLAAGGGGGGRGLSVRSAAGSAGAEAEKPTNVVLDTTGSVVYLSAATRQALMTTYFVVHLVASDGMLAEMTEGYFATPKPVVWGPREGGVWDGIREGDADGVAALRRCYPALLAQRRQRYGTLAHVAVPAEVARDPAVDGDAFWAAIREQLPDDRGDGRGGVVFGRFGG